MTKIVRFASILFMLQACTLLGVQSDAGQKATDVDQGEGSSGSDVEAGTDSLETKPAAGSEASDGVATDAPPASDAQAPDDVSKGDKASSDADDTVQLSEKEPVLEPDVSPRLSPPPVIRHPVVAKQEKALPALLKIRPDFKAEIEASAGHLF